MAAVYNGLTMTEEDVKKILAAQICCGTQNIRAEMRPYIYRRSSDSLFIFDIRKFWDKLVLAARVLVAIEAPGDICVISERQYGKRAVLKFANFTGAMSMAGKYTPGTFTNQITKKFCEPRILVCQSPVGESQAITEASYMNIPVVAFCNSDSHLKNVDVAIPCNTNGKEAIGTCWWMLCRQLLKFRAKIPAQLEWEVMPDLFFYRDLDEVEEQEQDKEVEAEVVDDWAQPTVEPAGVAATGFADDALTAFPTDGDVPDNWADMEYQDGTAVPAQPHAGVPATGMPQQDVLQGQYADSGFAPQQTVVGPEAVTEQTQQEPVMPTSYFPPEANDETW
jgi:small subunit ribosomal protein SAe